MARFKPPRVLPNNLKNNSVIYSSENEYIEGKLIVNGGITGSITTSSYAHTASYILNPSPQNTGSFTGSFIGDGSGLTNLPISNIDTGSLVTTSSFNSFTSSYNTGSFTGSFIGDGSGLTNLPVVNIDTGSLVTTASFNSFTSSYNTGSFTGSFVGDGSGLTNITTEPPASKLFNYYNFI